MDILIYNIEPSNTINLYDKIPIGYKSYVYDKYILAIGEDKIIRYKITTNKPVIINRYRNMLGTYRDTSKKYDIIGQHNNYLIVLTSSIIYQPSGRYSNICLYNIYTGTMTCDIEFIPGGLSRKAYQYKDKILFIMDTCSIKELFIYNITTKTIYKKNSVFRDCYINQNGCILTINKKQYIDMSKIKYYKNKLCVVNEESKLPMLEYYKDTQFIVKYIKEKYYVVYEIKTHRWIAAFTLHDREPIILITKTSNNVLIIKKDYTNYYVSLNRYSEVEAAQNAVTVSSTIKDELMLVIA